METLDCKAAAARLRAWDKILILCHTSPDGDTLGSASGLLRGLLAMGKQAWFACGDEIEPKYHYLFEGLARPAFQPEHIVSVDVATPTLLGALEKEYGGRVEMAIDHHGSHTEFAQESWIEPGAAAVCELIYLLLEELGVKLDKKIAACLYTGLSTDTGCFRYSNVTPLTHRIAASLVEAGAPAGEINRVMFECKSRAQLEAERLVMEGIAFTCGGKCAIVQVPHSVYERTGARESELEGAASLPRQIEGVVVGVTMKEKEDGTVKASLRVNAPANAAAICEQFGGGGHVGAAGCSFAGCTLAEATAQMAAACERHLASLGLA